MFSGTVNALAPLLLSRMWHGSIAVGDTGYVFGGMAGGTPTVVTEKWSLEMQAILSARSSCNPNTTTTLSNGRKYSCLWVFSPVSETLARLSPTVHVNHTNAFELRDQLLIVTMISLLRERE